LANFDGLLFILGNDIDTFRGVCYFFPKAYDPEKNASKTDLIYGAGGKTVNAANIDEFGYDPGIRRMRRVFSQMEAVSTKLIGDAGISPFDPRLRRWREAARVLFERGWAAADRRNLSLADDDAGILYGFALKRLMERDGVPEEKLQVMGSQDARTREISGLVP